jgi:hypothetical protein
MMHRNVNYGQHVITNGLMYGNDSELSGREITRAFKRLLRKRGFEMFTDFSVVQTYA